MENNLLETGINETTDMIKETTFERYLLQIHRIKLQDYIQCGLISPDIYLGSEIERDTQSLAPQFLVLSEGYIDELDEYQILIEIILTDEEKTSLHLCGDVCYYARPLPITRIKKVYVQDKAIIQHIVATLKTSEKGFLSENLFASYTQKKQCIFNKKSYSSVPPTLQSIDFSDQIRSFDKRMGMFAFMKNTAAYYCNNTASIANYSENYFAILSKILDKKLDDRPYDGLSIISQNPSFKELLYSKEQINESFIETIAQSIEDSEIKELFLKILEPNSTRKILPLLLEKKAELYYYISLVYYFRQKDSNRKDSFKIDIKNIIPASIAETALAILGIYLGYRNLRSSEQIEIHDKTFLKLLGNSWNMKFKLDSKLDYITIEAVYCHSFNVKNNDDTFDYLSYSHHLSKAINFPKDKEFSLWYTYTSEDKEGAQYFKLHKKTAKEIIEHGLELYNEEIALGKDHLLSYIAKYFKYLISYSKQGKPVEPFCNKNEVISTLKEEHHKIKISELVAFFELDKKA